MSHTERAGIDMADTDDLSTIKERARKKLERDMGPLLLSAMSSSVSDHQPSMHITGSQHGG